MGHKLDLMQDSHYDYFGIDEYLKGNSACHIMEEDEIYKVIRNKNDVDSHAGHHHKVDPISSKNLVQQFIRENKGLEEAVMKLGLG